MNPNMSKLPRQVKELVNEGIYSVYLTDTSDGVLVTDEGEYFLISSSGEILKKMESLAGIKLGDSINFPGGESPSQIKANII